MALWLKQSTAITIKLGPFVDKTDGVTEEVALTLDVEVAKNGGAFANRNSASAISHDASGWYAVPLDATDTGTLGRLQVKAHDAANALPVWQEFMVVPANVYDSLVAGTDNLIVDTEEIGANVITATSIAADAITAGKIAADAIGSSELAATAIAEIWAYTGVDPSAVPAVNASMSAKVDYIMAWLRNKRTQDATQEILYADNGSTVVATRGKSDNGTTLTVNEAT